MSPSLLLCTLVIMAAHSGAPDAHAPAVAFPADQLGDSPAKLVDHAKKMSDLQASGLNSLSTFEEMWLTSQLIDEGLASMKDSKKKTKAKATLATVKAKIESGVQALKKSKKDVSAKLLASLAAPIATLGTDLEAVRIENGTYGKPKPEAR